MAIGGGTAIRAGKAYVELFVENNKLVRGLRLAEARLKAFGDKVGAMGRKLLLISGAAAVPFVFATKAFGAFEDQMKAVQAVTGATGDEFQRLYDQAKKLGRTTSFTAGEVGAGQLSLARAGFDPAEIEAAIPGVLNLARATGTDLAQSADIAAGTLRAFALDASEMGRVTDVLVATANNSAQTLEDLGESMKYAAPLAEEYGLSLEEVAKSLGVMANMQIKGSMAGTTMRQAMLRLADPKVQQQIEALGVATKDATGNLRSDFGTMLLEIGRAMKGMPNAQRLALFKDLFDMRAAAGMAKLAKADFPALAEAIDNAGGVAERTAKVMDSGLGGAWRRMMSAIEGVQIAVGEALAGALGGLMDKVAQLSGWITQIIAENKEWIFGLALTIAGIAAAGSALITFGLAAKIAAIAISGIVGALSLIVAPLGLALGLLGALLTPVGAVSAAVIGLAGYFIYASGAGADALTWLGAKFNELRETASKVLQGISDAFAAGDLALAGKIFWLSLQVEWKKGVGALYEIWVGFKQIFLNAWTDAVYGLAGIFTRGVAILQEVWTRFSAGVIDKWKAAEQTMATGIAYLIAKAEGLDPREVMQNVREDYARQGRTRQAATGTRLQEIGTQREATLDTLEEDRRREIADRESRYGAALGEAAKELEGLARERDTAIAAAAAAAAAREAGGLAGEGPKLDAKQREAMAGGLGVAEAATATSTAGTFSAAAAELLGGQPKTLEQIRQEAIQTNRFLSLMERHARRGEAKWGA